MSGICCVVALDGAPADTSILERMVAAAAYRGPDGIGRWSDGAAALAHLATRTTPESMTETQPAVLADPPLVLVADAVLYNRPELIAELGHVGGGGTTPSDADLLLAAYTRWGRACPAHLEGDYAFAVWDPRSRSLFCARDPLGIRPLHYATLGNLLLVASEAHQILACPGFPRDLDEIALADHLSNLCIDEDRTAYRAIQALPPAHTMTVSASGLRLLRYWTPNPDARIVYREPAQYGEHLRELLVRSVGDRLRTTAPAVGLLMSGGLDSCSIAAVAQRRPPAQHPSARLVACSYVFDEVAACDERSYINQVVAELDLSLVTVTADAIPMLSELPDAHATLETPFGGWSSLTEAALLNLRDRGALVVLTGSAVRYCRLGNKANVFASAVANGRLLTLARLARQARDAGISRRRAAWKFLLRPLVPARVQDLVFMRSDKLRGRRAPPWLPAALAIRTSLAQRLRLVDEREVRDIWQELRHQQRPELWSSAGSVGRAVYHYDRIAANLGMETRHPLMDRRILAFLFAIPPETVYGVRRNRMVLRDAAGCWLPECVRKREDKTTFIPLLERNLRRDAAQLKELLRAPWIARLGFADGALLKDALDRFLSSPPDVDLTWMLHFSVTLELWLRAINRAPCCAR